MYSKFLSDGSFVSSASSVESPTNLASHALSNSQHYTKQPCTSAPVDVDVLYPSERSDLLKLRDSTNSSLDLHQRWTGPPCLGDESRWVGVGCSNSHVVQLVLDGIQLTGLVPENFLHSVAFLTKLSLRNNSIFEALPALVGLLHLEDVSLSHNRFSDSIPSEYAELSTPTKLELQGNVLVRGFASNGVVSNQARVWGLKNDLIDVVWSTCATT
ncbi:probable LRR receptor-like serine/threonine-protein kinase At4g31250 [Punica granatum]|uniref:Uncharacterized protein n=2 Tax=Punica granatum TaxID=22663 RepID=A0A2I0IHG4_PUNGR|nr:probable LRR receptor-like serine/threonine-protein kinase At4g31250 [Punica granatum]PKI43449.1 hypothetical protein CRG98_036206 [Punica granatum]